FTTDDQSAVTAAAVTVASIATDTTGTFAGAESADTAGSVAAAISEPAVTAGTIATAVSEPAVTTGSVAATVSKPAVAADAHHADTDADTGPRTGRAAAGADRELCGQQRRTLDKCGELERRGRAQRRDRGDPAGERLGGTGQQFVQHHRLTDTRG